MLGEAPPLSSATAEMQSPCFGGKTRRPCEVSRARIPATEPADNDASLAQTGNHLESIVSLAPPGLGDGILSTQWRPAAQLQEGQPLQQCHGKKGKRGSLPGGRVALLFAGSTMRGGSLCQESQAFLDLAKISMPSITAASPDVMFDLSLLEGARKAYASAVNAVSVHLCRFHISRLYAWVTRSSGCQEVVVLCPKYIAYHGIPRR